MRRLCVALRRRSLKHPRAVSTATRFTIEKQYNNLIRRYYAKEKGEGDYDNLLNEHEEGVGEEEEVEEGEEDGGHISEEGEWKHDYGGKRYFGPMEGRVDSESQNDEKIGLTPPEPITPRRALALITAKDYMDNWSESHAHFAAVGGNLKSLRAAVIPEEMNSIEYADEITTDRDLSIIREATIRFGEHLYKPQEINVPQPALLDMIEEHKAAGYLTGDAEAPYRPWITYYEEEGKKPKNDPPQEFDRGKNYEYDVRTAFGAVRGRPHIIRAAKRMAEKVDRDNVRITYERDLERRSSLLGLGPLFETEGEQFQRRASEVNYMNRDHLRTQVTVLKEQTFIGHSLAEKPPGDIDRTGELREYNRYLAGVVSGDSQEVYDNWKQSQLLDGGDFPEIHKELGEHVSRDRVFPPAIDLEDKIMDDDEKYEIMRSARFREEKRWGNLQWSEQNLFVKARREVIDHIVRRNWADKDSRESDDEDLVEEYEMVLSNEEGHPDLSSHPLHEIMKTEYDDVDEASQKLQKQRVCQRDLDDDWHDPSNLNQLTGDVSDEVYDYAMNIVFDGDEALNLIALDKKHKAVDIKYAADEPNPAATQYHQVVDSFMEVMLRTDRLGYKWFCNPVSNQEMYRWYDPIWVAGLTRLPMASYSPKIRRSITIDWKSWKMLVQEEDTITNKTKSRTIDVPSDWLLAFKKVPWPNVRNDRPPVEFDAYYPATRASLELSQIVQQERTIASKIATLSPSRRK